MFNRLKHFLPAGPETHRHFLPGQFLRPVCQKLLIGNGKFLLTPRPGHLLDFNATFGAIDTPHQVNQKYPVAPQGYELKTALVQPIIQWCWLLTTATDSLAVTTRKHVNLNVFFPIPVNKTYLIVYERLEFLALIQDSLQLHLLSFGFGSDKSGNSSLPKPGSRCTPFILSAVRSKICY
jgi:hypothetical protein